ncbi:MAG: hypothetical protein DBX55_00495 [Verrucomicrobia bacterium]|nr:MAG: hypothetical protein DBX55_00495 [Verrucomicrobiota bacterium]
MNIRAAILTLRKQSATPPRHSAQITRDISTPVTLFATLRRKLPVAEKRDFSGHSAFRPGFCGAMRNPTSFLQNQISRQTKNPARKIPPKAKMGLPRLKIKQPPRAKKTA